MGFMPNLLSMFRGKAGGSQMNPAQQKAQARVDDYRSKNWAADDTIDMDLWNKQAGVQGGAGAPSSEQQSQMFGQMGDPKKAMGSIWDQIKTGAGKFKQGVQNLDKKMESNYAASGWGGENYKNPYAEPTPEIEPSYTTTLEDLENLPKEERVKAIDEVTAAQQTPEGQAFKENMNKYKQEGDFAAGQALGQSYGGPMGGMLQGWLAKAMGKANPYKFEVEQKHRYQKPRQ
tara:strand:- start:7925 stop:8617 length:693 start_codon:yes stop_codon:yes gene_type:complete